MAFKEAIAEDPICWEKYKAFDNVNRENFTAMDLLPEMKIRIPFTGLFETMMSSTIFTTLVVLNYVFISSFTSILLVSLHHQIYVRETSNSWYSSTAFFISKLVVDAIVRIFVIIPGTILLFHLSGASVEFWRVSTFIVFLFFILTIWENFSYCVTIIGGATTKNLLGIVALLIACQVIDLLFSDLVAFERNIWWILKYVERILPLNNIYLF